LKIIQAYRVECGIDDHQDRVAVPAGTVEAALTMLTHHRRPRHVAADYLVQGRKVFIFMHVYARNNAKL